MESDFLRVRPLVPRLLPQEIFCGSMVRGVIINRFDSPVARLINLPENLISEVCSVDIRTPDDDIEQYFNEGKISYTALASIRYETTDSRVINVTTMLMSRKTSELEYRASQNVAISDGVQAVTPLTLEDGTQAMIFNNPEEIETTNQIVFIKDGIYYITVASNLSIDRLSEIISANLVIK